MPCTSAKASLLSHDTSFVKTANSSKGIVCTPFLLDGEQSVSSTNALLMPWVVNYLCEPRESKKL